MRKLILAALLIGFISSLAIAQVEWKEYRSFGPEKRTGLGMVYDQHRKKIVLFGGEQSYSIELNDTWEWDVVSKKWTEIKTSEAPQGRKNFAMAYDSGRHRVVLQGGYQYYWSISPSTWEYDGSNWHYITGAGPGGIYDHSMVYESHKRRLLIFGGRDQDYKEHSETWVYKDGYWQMANDAPFSRTRYTMAYDEKNRNVVLFGGSYSYNTFLWDGASWSLIDPTESNPDSSSYSAMVYHRDLNRILMFSGVTPWLWDGKRWRQIQNSSDSSDMGKNAYSANLVYDDYNDGIWAYGSHYYDDGSSSIYFLSVKNRVDFHVRKVKFIQAERVYPGDEIDFSIALKNLGEEKTSNYRVNVYASLDQKLDVSYYGVPEEILLTSKYIRKKIEPGKKLKLSFKVKIDEMLPPDDYYLIAVVEPKENDLYVDNNYKLCKQKLRIYDR